MKVDKMSISVGTSYKGPLGLVFTVESVTAEWTVCRVGPGLACFPTRDWPKWLKSLPEPNPDPDAPAAS